MKRYNGHITLNKLKNILDLKIKLEEAKEIMDKAKPTSSNPESPSYEWKSAAYEDYERRLKAEEEKLFPRNFGRFILQEAF